MKNRITILLYLSIGLTFSHCGKKSSGEDIRPTNIILQQWSVNGVTGQTNYGNVSVSPLVRFRFSGPVNRATVASAVSFKKNSGETVAFTTAYDNGDSTILIRPAQSLEFLSRYKLTLTSILESASGGTLNTGAVLDMYTQLDSSRKFPVISDDALLTKVQQQTFKYFWDFGHPVSGLARERTNTSGDIVTSGGSGFGIMAILTGIERGFITRAEGFARMQKIVGFLKNTADRFHGAFPHWLNGGTGKVIPFSANDDGADLVETSYLIQGLLCARQYFNTAATAEASLRDDINSIWNGVEWDWFRRNNQNTLYWHWSPNNANEWVMNLPIKGWNECLITYVLAAASTTHSIPRTVYDNGWASNGNMKNGNSYYGFPLPLGPSFGGPLFFAHYSFLGIDPNGLTDAYANYGDQTRNHALINYTYCKTNPGNFFGYSDSVWGLTASDIPNGYAASSPTADIGVIAPTAALSSFPYTPTESMAALKFFYYVLGDRIWKEYGFVDAFSLKEPWFAESFLAIDQGPIIVMIENYRSGLLWDLFTSCPEVKTGMTTLGFSAPYL